jgi:hypothetical protein
MKTFKNTLTYYSLAFLLLSLTTIGVASAGEPTAYRGGDMRGGFDRGYDGDHRSYGGYGDYHHGYGNYDYGHRNVDVYDNSAEGVDPYVIYDNDDGY